jgi:hypothetical protein
VRSYNAAGLVNELILAQAYPERSRRDEHRLPEFLATALGHRLIVLDELGFIAFSALGTQGLPSPHAFLLVPSRPPGVSAHRWLSQPDDR